MAAMRYRVLGSSGVKASEISLGTMMFGAATEAAESRRIIDHAADSGVNFIERRGERGDAGALGHGLDAQIA